MVHISKMEDFLNIHKDQLVSSGIPKYLWRTLYIKLMNETFDASSAFDLLRIEDDSDGGEDVIQSRLILQATRNIKTTESEHIYLIDHAWTYRIQDARNQLLSHTGLRERLCDVFGLDTSQDKHEIVDQLFNLMWKINNYYSIRNTVNVEDSLPVWYIMDEVGTAVTHSDKPNCRIVPFVYINEKITYSLLFPITDIEEDDIICRDYAEGVQDSSRKEAILLPWVHKSFEDFSIIPPVPSKEYFLSGHSEESLPNLDNLQNKKNVSDVLKVYSQYSLVTSHLHSNRFQIVDNEDDADIMWFTEHFKDFNKLSETPHKFINQFPFEYVLTVKDLLCITCRRKTDQNWLPITYNLLTELPNFLSYYQKRETDGMENYWIVKPYNLARSLDMHITDNLDYILRVSITGPKIVQKYITNPVLFYRPECEGTVKFDIRYVILLKSVEPLQCFVYKNFFLRFANKPFELNEFEDYEKHFTVMNYTENVQLKHMKCNDFILNWKIQYPDNDWNKVEQSIFKMLKEVLECAISEKPPCGIAHSPQSRSLYAVDLMLEWTEDKEIQPKILEVNFVPDCARACDYYPDFYDDIFGVLFLDRKCDTILPL
ncbi:tubulin--tyrosine ligase-like protein 12 [Diorhabda sublineata]|uniref:tubulin--tyrosine ligase-like protein 12 n=1 Tax=Diorhabda sublineata TaxID=1163346 RepID=UPI0024E16178|nr:tubulin--tyrosine ligase-like protein 12 [Diorhabda sublineata]